jgi:hypothetical protein
MAPGLRGKMRWAALLAAALLGAVVGHGAPADAYCGSSDRKLFYVLFETGSAVPGKDLRARLTAYLSPSVSADSRVASYYVLASGDIGEGADWAGASMRARSADKALGAARAAAIASLLHTLPPALRADSIELKIRENRQVFSQAELRANPFLNPRIRAGIVAYIRPREDERRKGEPVPLC